MFKNYFIDFFRAFRSSDLGSKTILRRMLQISKILCFLQSSCLLCRKWKHNQLFMGYYVAARLPGRWHLQIKKKCFMKQRILSQGLHNCSLMANMLPILYKYRISLYVYTLSKNLFSTLFYYFLRKLPSYTFIRSSYYTWKSHGIFEKQAIWHPQFLNIL